MWRGIEQGLNAAMVNPAVIIGPGDWRFGSPSFFKAVSNGLPFYTNGGTGFVDVRDVVAAMLPERLSNQICSLRPDEEKLCFSAVFELDGDAIVVSEWFGRTIIKSQRRFSYEEAQQVIETNAGDMKEEIIELNRLARILRKRRFKDGAIAFERDEVKFELDEHGKPLRVFYKVHKESNQLIEEFMLLANKKVAEFVGKVGKKKSAPTFVYRIHDQPNPEKFNDFRKFITRFGYALSPSLKPSDVSSSINHLLEEIKDKPEANLISTLAIRSMIFLKLKLSIR